jgi:hypothetical protein
MVEQSKSLKATDGKKLLDRFPNWSLFLISALAIFFSPYSYSGYVMGLSSIAQINLLPWVVEVILFVVGMIPFAILDIREKRPFMLLIGIFAIVDIGSYWIGGILVFMAGGLHT